MINPSFFLKSRVTLLKLITLCLLLSLSKSSTSQIVNLTDANFEEYKSKHPIMLLYFHASYSEESEKLQLQFRSLPNLLTGTEILYAIVSQREYIINHKYNVEFPYPKIILVNKDSYYEYKGEMKANSIYSWVERKLHKKLEFINTPEDFEEAMVNWDRIVCLVGEDSHLEKFSNSSLTDTFTDLHFYAIKNLTFLQSLNIPEKYKNLDEKIILLKNYDDRVNIYSGDILDGQKVENFIRTFIYPMINHLSQTNYLYAVNNKISFAVLLLPNEIAEENLNTLISELKNSAGKLRGELFFMYGNYSDQYQTTLAIDFEVEEKDLPAVMIQEYSKDSVKTIIRYKLENIDLTQEEKTKKLTEFFDKFKYKALKRFLKSESIRESTYSEKDNVNHLVRKNFEDVIINSNQDKFALVYFVRRNCGPCNEYYKEFLKVSDKLRNEKNLLFAYIDGLSNEFDEFDIPGFPSVLLFKPG